MKQLYSMTLTALAFILASTTLAQDPPLLDNISIIDAATNQHREYMEVGEGKTAEVSFWEGINFRLNTTPEVIGNYRLTIEIFKDGGSTPYWTKSRGINPYCAFASTSSFEYTSWKDDADAFSQAPPVEGSYNIKFTLTDTNQNPISGVVPFERNFTITSSTVIDESQLNKINVWSDNQIIHFDSPNYQIDELMVFNLSGQLLYHESLNISKYNSSTNLPIGVYLVKLKVGKQFICKKVIVQ